MLLKSDDPPPPFDAAAAPAPAAEPYRDALPAPSTSAAPPPFAPYDAAYAVDGRGNIVSHDPHLNSDGEALYRFLLTHAAAPPALRLHCRGSHDEHRSRWVSHTDAQGRTTSRRESYTEAVVDFDFRIDASPCIAFGPDHFSVPDSEPAYRGRMVRDLSLPVGTRRATRAERKAFKRSLAVRRARGLPPAAAPADHADLEAGPVLQSSRSLRAWADDYCASPKLLKEFVYHRVVYGWDFDQLVATTRSAITGVEYHGNLAVAFEFGATRISVRADNTLSRLLSNKWLRFLSFLLLIYPFIWLFKRFHPRGGGRWEVGGGGYALKRYIRDDAGRTVPQGVREGEWFHLWEASILRAVRTSYNSDTPLTAPFPIEAARHLDGLAPAYSP